MRITMIELMVEKWKHIEKFHHAFIQSVFDIFLRVSLLPPKTSRTILIPLFFDIMKLSFRFVILVDTLLNYLAFISIILQYTIIGQKFRQP